MANLWKPAVDDERAPACSPLTVAHKVFRRVARSRRLAASILVAKCETRCVIASRSCGFVRIKRLELVRVLKHPAAVIVNEALRKRAFGNDDVVSAPSSMWK